MKAKFLNYFIGICLVTYFLGTYAKPLLNQIVSVADYSKTQELVIQYTLSFGIVTLSIGIGALTISTIQLALDIKELRKSKTFNKILEHIVLSVFIIIGASIVIIMAILL